jgi:hypothetical protein
MQDGVISKDEQDDLDALVKHLNLNDVDARAIQFAIQHQHAKDAQCVCPHCGKNLNDPVDIEGQ